MNKQFKKKKPFRKFGKKRKTFTKFKGKKTGANMGMISYFAPNQLPIAPRYRCKFCCDQQGFISAGAASGQFNINFNNPIAPYNTISTNIPNPATATVNQYPAFFHTLVGNNAYRYFRVYASKISLQLIPQTIADVINVTITPTDFSNIPSNVLAAIQQPFTKQAMFQANQMRGPLINEMTQHRLIGCTKRALQDDLSGGYTGAFNAAPTEPNWWCICWNTPDTANLSATVNYVCKMTYYVELWGLDVAALPLT